MKSIKEIVPTPIDALQVMVDSLKEFDKAPDFEVYMGSWGAQREGICIGCAATCTIQKIAEKRLTTSVIWDCESRAKFLDFDFDDLNAFENAIDQCRSGRLEGLWAFYGTEDCPKNTFWYLGNFEWRDNLEKVEKFIKRYTPTVKDEAIEAALTKQLGKDRRRCIKQAQCVPSPIGCGNIADNFEDEASIREYQISGLCQTCQDNLFGGVV